MKQDCEEFQFHPPRGLRIMYHQKPAPLFSLPDIRPNPHLDAVTAYRNYLKDMVPIFQTHMIILNTHYT